MAINNITDNMNEINNIIKVFFLLLLLVEFYMNDDS